MVFTHMHKVRGNHDESVVLESQIHHFCIRTNDRFITGCPASGASQNARWHRFTETSDVNGYTHTKS